MASAKPIKCVVVGDGCVGKTCLLIQYTQGSFPTEYVPTVFDNFEADVLIEGMKVNYSLWDTAGQEGYKRIRCLSYPNTDIFIIGYSIADHNSFINVQERWLPELRHFSPTTKFIIVGLKSDLRNEQGTIDDLSGLGLSLITPEQGASLAKREGALNYYECSALTGAGIKEVFNSALYFALGLDENGKRPAGIKSLKKSKACNLL